MNVVGVLVVFGVILVSMVLHELAHGWVAYLLGDTTAKDDGRLTLNPLKHLDPVMSVALPLILYIMGMPVFGGAKPVPIDSRNLKGREWGMAAVAIAGPATNFLLAFLSFLVGHFTGIIYDGGFLALVFQEILMVNLGFMAFNMLPIPPLDGSRILYAVAPDGVRSVMKKIEMTAGVMIVYVFILVFSSAFYTVISGVVNSVLNFFYWIIGQ